MKRLLKLVAYLLVVALITATTAYVTYRFLITRMTVEVPDLASMTIEDADRALASRGLYLKVAGDEYDLAVPAGRIISQDVAAGSHVKGLGEIQVIVSKGPDVRLIPNVVGMSVQDARALFARDGLEIGVVKVHSDTVEPGKIIAQSPRPEEWAGQSITVIASSGPYDVIYYVPSFLGLMKEDALELARELGFNVELVLDDDYANVVVSQRPSPGRNIESGGTIRLELKRG